MTIFTENFYSRDLSLKLTLEKSDSLGTKSRRKRLWDYLGGPNMAEFSAECHSMEL